MTNHLSSTRHPPEDIEHELRSQMIAWNLLFAHHGRHGPIFFVFPQVKNTSRLFIWPLHSAQRPLLRTCRSTTKVWVTTTSQTASATSTSKKTLICSTGRPVTPRHRTSVWISGRTRPSVLSTLLRSLTHAFWRPLGLRIYTRDGSTFGSHTIRKTLSVSLRGTMISHRACWG